MIPSQKLGIDSPHIAAIVANPQTRDDAAVGERNDRRAKRGIDVAVRVEDVLEQPLGTTIRDAVELRADQPTITTVAMAGSAVLCKDRLASRGRADAGPVPSAARAGEGVAPAAPSETA